MSKPGEDSEQGRFSRRSRRANETPEQKRERLESMRSPRQQSRASETPDKRQERLVSPQQYHCKDRGHDKEFLSNMKPRANESSVVLDLFGVLTCSHYNRLLTAGLHQLID